MRVYTVCIFAYAMPDDWLKVTKIWHNEIRDRYSTLVHNNKWLHYDPVNRTLVIRTHSVPRYPDCGSPVNGNGVYKIRYPDSPLSG